jgi:hypothetical protein
VQRVLSVYSSLPSSLYQHICVLLLLLLLLLLLPLWHQCMQKATSGIADTLAPTVRWQAVTVATAGRDARHCEIATNLDTAKTEGLLHNHRGVGTMQTLHMMPS